MKKKPYIIILPILLLLAFSFAHKIDDISYSQNDLYKLYKIDTVIEKNNEFLKYSIIDSNGVIIKTVEYCDSSIIKHETYFNKDGLEIKSISYDCQFPNDTSLISISKYDNNRLIIDSVNWVRNGIISVYRYYYDQDNRKKELQYYDLGYLEYKETYSYLDKPRQMKTIRSDGDGSIIFTSITYINKTGLDSLLYNYHDDQLTSIYVFEYDLFNNLKRKAGYFFPGRLLEVDNLYFYSSKYKIDSSSWLSFSDKRNMTKYYYDDKGLMKRKIYYDHSNTKIPEIITITEFEYRYR
jgi:hypothetical protein